MKVEVLKKLALREIRIHLCPRNRNSDGVRQFIQKHYEGIKKDNPTLPILIRECTGVEPKMWFRFEFGTESSATLANLNADQISGLLKENLSDQTSQP